MRLFDKVAIIGVGLVGGSLGLCIKKKGLAAKVVGVSRRRQTLLLAKKRGAIDQGSRDLGIIKDAGLVILATPVNTILSIAPRIAKVIRPDCIVSDVGSTKKQIVSCLERVFAGFVGCHPLAGSEKQGVRFARPGLFSDSLCILTPSRNTSRSALARIKKLWLAVGARVIFLSPDKHDETLAFVSHLPHAAAFSLAGAVPQGFLKFASTGFKDTTRIAASDSEIWADIFLSNQKNMLRSISIFEQRLGAIKSAIKKKDRVLLRRILKQARDKRLSLNH